MKEWMKSILICLFGDECLDAVLDAFSLPISCAAYAPKPDCREFHDTSAHPYSEIAPPFNVKHLVEPL